jgi:arylformamidase
LYNQASLDSQFNNRQHVPAYQEYLDRWERCSWETEKKLPVIKDIPYGSLPGERFDVYPSSRPLSKTLIFIHGGYWHLLDKAQFHFLASGFFSYGVTTVLLNYPLVPAVAIDQIVRSCKKAIRWLCSHLATYNGDPHQMYVTGHSAGGHLAAMLMATDWKGLDPSFPDAPLRGACFISGLFNLIPIHLSYLNKVLHLDSKAAVRNSPLRLGPVATSPLIAAVGEAETKEFKEQSKELYEGWKEKGAAIQLLQLPGLNHYSIVETMVDQKAALHQAICRMMEIKVDNG